ncbi:MAG: acetylglutamate kinase, partial [Candidatus Omnitrophica bacterium]|nr:acetylglutamate kinase [Candidatus Omnitrophota bacterium]
MERIVEKANILIEALPYIKKFRGKEIVIKYGGAAMDNEDIRHHILSDLVFMNYVGIRPILVHGGGPAISQAMKEKGITPKFVDGHRVTDKDMIELVASTLANINKEIVHDINHMGARAIGLSGFHNEVLNVVKRQNAGNDIGYVGDITSVNIMPIKELTEFNIIPVIYPLGIDEKGEMYNVNGDSACSRIAVAMKAQKLMVLTNVAGILRDVNNPDSLLSTVRLKDVDMLKEKKIISGGMMPKVDACV